MAQHKNKVEKDTKAIIKAYEYLVLGMDKKAQDDMSERAYGGILRAGKGKLVESITKELVKIAWKDLEQDVNRLEFKRNQIKVSIRKGYINKIKNIKAKKYILDNMDKCHYGQKTDVHLYIDGKFVMAIECKAYTENAMMKRILVDFTLLKEVYPNLDCVLLQLESQLGGDYGHFDKKPLGSFRTHNFA